MAPRSGFPLAADRPLYSELLIREYNLPHATSRRSFFIFRGQAEGRRLEGDWSSGLFRAECCTRPPRLLCPILSPPPTAIPCPTPWARTAVLGRTHFHPWEVEPALPGRRVAPAPAAFLSSSARPPTLRRLLLKLGEAWPSLSQIPVVRLPLRRAFPR